MRAGWNRVAILVRSPTAIPTGTRCLVLQEWTCIWDLWTFSYSLSGVEEEEPHRAEVNLFRSASGMGNPADIPVQSPAAMPTGTHCLVLEQCKPHEVAGIHRALGLGYSQHQRDQHQRDQVEAMWLDGQARDGNGDPVHGRLHIWYTSIRAAQEAKMRCIRAAQEAKMRWPPLEYEWDPCSNSPPSLILSLEEIQAGEVAMFKHSHPFVNLIEVNQDTIFEVNQDTIFNAVMNGLVDTTRVYWRPGCAGPPWSTGGTRAPTPRHRPTAVKSVATANALWKTAEKALTTAVALPKTAVKGVATGSTLPQTAVKGVATGSTLTLMLRLEEIQAGEVAIFQHSYPFVNLIEGVNRSGSLRDWLVHGSAISIHGLSAPRLKLRLEEMQAGEVAVFKHSYPFVNLIDGLNRSGSLRDWFTAAPFLFMVSPIEEAWLVDCGPDSPLSLDFSGT
ncbi:hypothetical protein KVR01_005835 [Diaporthe batatas]|uniref:uncharacterized protein n=1 Tax=Diaporthe batatas TaxID=748121 RepID=UPI001D053CEE|nr:uncharacterized protein KVR01_005835 [Diaporthe batatas]KAG8163917.1 hypothetical protein KVR01_005835 [Diaporthe batatas]